MRIALVLLVVSLIGCSRRNPAGISLDKTSTPFVSSDTTVLAGANLDQLKTAPFYQAHQSLLAFPALDNNSQRLGLDPRRDLSTAVVTWNGHDSLVIVRGRFSRAKLQQTLTANSPRRAYKDVTLYGSSGNSFALPSDGLALGGSTKGVEHGVDAHASGFSDDLPEGLQQGLSWLPKTAQIWVVSRGTLPFADIPTRSDYASLLSNFVGYIQATATGLTVDAGLHLRSRIQCVSEEGGKRVNDALRGGIGLGRLSTKDNQLELLRLYDAIHVRQDKQTVYIEADLSSAEADQLLKLLPVGPTGAISRPR